MKAQHRYSLRGRKKARAPSFEPAPIITDIPPLPFTTSSQESSPQSKRKQKAKHKSHAKKTKKKVVKETTTEHGSVCDFCKKVANICVLMHCTACRRMYHAQCLVHAFKPHVDKKLPIEQQMEHLQLNTPGRRGGIFRCASCKAAFIDFYKSRGFQWDCTCPTCVQPEKLLEYRRRTLVGMLAEKELQGLRKKSKVAVDTESENEAETSKVATEADSDLPLVVASDEKNDTNAINVDEEAIQSQTPKVEKSKQDVVKAELNDSDTITQVTFVETKFGQLSVDGDSAVAVLEQQDEATNTKPVEDSTKPKLQRDDLVAAVAVRGENNGRWSFAIACSRTQPLRISTSHKRGVFIWCYQRHGVIRCECCGNTFRCAWFVHHIDSTLLKDPKSSESEAMPFLFVEHSGGEYSPLDTFLAAWETHFTRRKLSTSIETNAKPAAEELSTSLAQLKSLALTKNLRANSWKIVSSMEFLARVVCLSPKYVMKMANGSLVDLVVRSELSDVIHAFPRKAGWLGFSRLPFVSKRISCACCDRYLSFDDFVKHAFDKKTDSPRDVLYVVQRTDESVIVPYNTFALDLEHAATCNELSLILDGLQPL